MKKSINIKANKNITNLLSLLKEEMPDFSRTQIITISLKNLIDINNDIDFFKKAHHFSNSEQFKNGKLEGIRFQVFIDEKIYLTSQEKIRLVFGVERVTAPFLLKLSLASLIMKKYNNLTDSSQEISKNYNKFPHDELKSVISFSLLITEARTNDRARNKVKRIQQILKE
jgi:hypothetical protein